MKQKDIFDIILGIKTKKDLKLLFEDMLTPKEYKEFENRFEILKGLKSGESQRILADRLKVGIATITKGSKVLQKEKNWFKKYF